MINLQAKKPKLVIGIVVDQMRYDYIDRFWNDFGNNGFKELINNGYLLKNTQFSYVPTYTGPGHASIFTGTTPSVHGIIANNWYDKHSKTNMFRVITIAYFVKPMLLFYLSWQTILNQYVCTYYCGK